MFYNFFGFYIQNCCEKNPKNTRGRCRCSKSTSPTVLWLVKNQFSFFLDWVCNVKVQLIDFVKSALMIYPLVLIN